MGQKIQMHDEMEYHRDPKIIPCVLKNVARGKRYASCVRHFH